MPNIPPEWRRWLYTLTAALIALLTAYQVVEDALAPLWLEVAGAFFGIAAPTLAAFNVPKKSKGEDQ